MKTGKEYSKIYRLVLCVVVMLMTTLASFGANNSLTGIDVKQNTSEEYNVILKLEGNAHVKKANSTVDSLTLVLNSTVPSDGMEIVYDNTSNVNNVIVQKKNADNTMIILEGKNIENANVYTKDISSGILTPVNTSKILFMVDKKMLLGSISAMFIWFLAMFGIKPKQNHTALQTNMNTQALIRNKNLIRAKNAPSIGYTANGHVSAPKDFIINRYLEDEKIRKAG